MSGGIKTVGVMTAASALATGGVMLASSLKARKQTIQHAEQVAAANNGRIPTGGMTKDGKLWDGFTTVDEVKKKSKKVVAISTAIPTALAAASTAAVSALTLIVKSKLFK